MSYSFSIFLKDFASSKLMKLSSNFDKLSNKVQNTQTKLQKNLNKSTVSIDSLNQKLSVLNAKRTASTSISDIRSLKTEINKTERQLKKLENLPPKGFRERLRGLGGKLGGMVGLAGGVGIAMSAWGGVKSLFNLGADLEQTNIKFEVLLGSTEKAKKLLGELNSYANFTPYSNGSIQKGAETMLGFGIAEEKVMGNMKMLGDVAMGNEQKLSGLSLVYSQIQATGRLMGQDLLQLINQGFNPLQVISENTGLSMATLKKQMEGGKISAGMIEEAFRLATAEGGRYHGMAEAMAESAGGKWSTFMGTFKMVVSRIGLKFAEWIKPLIGIGTTFVEKIIPFGKWVIDILPSIETLKTAFMVLSPIVVALGVNYLIANASAIAYSVSLGVLNGIISVVTGATALFNFVLSMNPISWVVLVIGALIVSLVLAWKKFDKFRGVVMGAWEVLKGLGTMIKNYVINRFKELLSGITGIGRALVAFFKGDWKKAWEIGEKAGKDLLGVNSKKQALKDGVEAFKSFGKGYEKGAKMYAPKIATPNTINAQNKKVKTPIKTSSIFKDLLKDTTTDKGKKELGNKAKGRSENIITGGRRTTHINVSIGNLGTDTKVYVSSVKEGIDDLGRRVQEELLRAVNSINQMQTA